MPDKDIPRIRLQRDGIRRITFHYPVAFNDVLDGLVVQFQISPRMSMIERQAIHEPPSGCRIAARSLAAGYPVSRDQSGASAMAWAFPRADSLCAIPMCP